MKNLNDKLSLTAPNTNNLVGTGFQEFILKERQQYLKSVSSATDNEQSLHGRSMSNNTNSLHMAPDMQTADFASRRVIA